MLPSTTPLRRRFSSAAPLADAVLSRLEAACRVTTNSSILDRHGDDESHHPSQPPAVVAFARSTEQVQAIVRLCAESRTPLIPFGAGTSLEGHIAATRGGVCLDMSEMDAVLHVSSEDMDCSVQAGLTRLSLNEHLRHSGLRFPVDPGADASIGGMAACGASGTSAVRCGALARAFPRALPRALPRAAARALPLFLIRCGTMSENVLGLRAVLASGEVITTGDPDPSCVKRRRKRP